LLPVVVLVIMRELLVIIELLVFILLVVIWLIGMFIRTLGPGVGDRVRGDRFYHFARTAWEE
jgi:hypothetical protein